MPSSLTKPKPLPPPPKIDLGYIQEILLRLLCQHSPTGYTDPVVRMVSEELTSLGIPFELTRRGAIRAELAGKKAGPDRAVVSHLDTLGAMVKALKDNGRLAVVPVGTWSARFAEGARVSIFTDEAMFRGTILPLKASGHTFHTEIDSQPSTWENLELRVDENITDRAGLEKLGFHVGDFIGVDASPEISPSGFINARHLDNKAGVAAMLGAMKATVESGNPLPVDAHMLFTISEETGSGASAVLHGDVAEMVSIDNGVVAPGQASRERGVTVAMGDSSGPFDYHLTHALLHLCRAYGIPHQRDIFKYYRCDSASAVDAGNDIRTALITFGVDSSHGYERTHFHSLESIAYLVCAYLNSPPLFRREVEPLSDIKGFPKTKTARVPEPQDL
ncbi:osmoprotectant NAGGN system M42 family peptidase [soil metagenome]